MKADSQPRPIERYDVVIIGAGISGIGAAYHLAKQSPDRTFVVLEANETFGGTWRTHTYPGIRSDSDLYTYGYRFKPWTGVPIASGEAIRRYIGEVIEENELGSRIRYCLRVVAATWSSRDALWTVEASRTDTGESVFFAASLLWMCQGYYRHDEGYTPKWPGMSDYEGRIIHPQSWPNDVDLTGKRVVVIGSGATAATLIPNIADKCAHVTMLQRSPTYFAYGKNANDLADTLRALQIDEHWIYEIARRQSLRNEEELTRRSFEEPQVMRQELLDGVRAFLSAEVVAKHFTPRYLPWRQRLAFLPDADLFQAIQSGKASVETDEIERFTADGLLLKSGNTLEADVVITATGFNMCVMGDIRFSVDGESVDFADTLTYRGMMMTGVPNMVWVFGYLRSSWTLRVDLVSDFVCRLLEHMNMHGYRKIEVAVPPSEGAMRRLPWMDPENFNPGYLMRSMQLLPKRGEKAEWQPPLDYKADSKEFPAIDLRSALFVYDERPANRSPVEQRIQNTPRG
jgi:cation diffusion facilitator CzcD-associated flavoprotein CzcO